MTWKVEDCILDITDKVVTDKLKSYREQNFIHQKKKMSLFDMSALHKVELLAKMSHQKKMKQ